MSRIESLIACLEFWMASAGGTTEKDISMNAPQHLNLIIQLLSVLRRNIVGISLSNTILGR